MMYGKMLVVVLLMMSTSGCVLTKVVSVPMRLGGAVISVIPIAGNRIHDGIDGAADAVDAVPL